MEIVVNRCYGGFDAPDEVYELLGIDTESSYFEPIERTNRTLINYVALHSNRHGILAVGDCAELEVITIPDTATDWEINEYDGYETVIYVLDGKLHHA